MPEPTLDPVQTVPKLISENIQSRLRQRMQAVTRAVLRRLIALNEVDALYQRVLDEEPQAAVDPLRFIEKTLEVLQINWQVSPADIQQISTAGPLVVVSNHPYGGLDGLMLLAILARVRPDTRIFANHLLQHIAEIRDFMLYQAYLQQPARRCSLRNLKPNAGLVTR